MAESPTLTLSSSSTLSRLSLLAHEFDTFCPSENEDGLPILEREDNSDLSSPPTTCFSSPARTGSFESYEPSHRDAHQSPTLTQQPRYTSCGFENSCESYTAHPFFPITLDLPRNPPPSIRSDCTDPIAASPRDEGQLIPRQLAERMGENRGRRWEEAGGKKKGKMRRARGVGQRIERVVKEALLGR